MRGFFLTIMVGGALISSTLLWWNGSDILNESGRVIQQLVDSNIQLYNELEYYRNQPIPPVETCPEPEVCEPCNGIYIPPFSQGQVAFNELMHESLVDEEGRRWWNNNTTNFILTQTYGNNMGISNAGIQGQRIEETLLANFTEAFGVYVKFVRHDHNTIVIRMEWPADFPRQ